MKKLTVLMLTIAALCITAAPVVAGERAGAFSLSPFGGGYTFDGDRQLKTAPVYGLRLGIDMTKNWGIEAVGDYLSTKGTRSQRSVNAASYRLDILYNLKPDGPMVPYLAIGGGAITVGHGESFQGGVNGTNSSNTDATANAGFGIKFFMTDSVALRGDARTLFIFEKHNSVMYDWEYTAGLTFLFGGNKPAAAAAQPPPAPSAPTSSMEVAPDSISKGEMAKLNWTSQNTTGCEITPNIGQVKPQGSMTVTPEADTTYYLSCNGPGGTSKSSAKITIAAPPPPKAPLPTTGLTVTPPSIKQGESATLTWSSQNATKCVIQPAIGPVEPKGSVTITPEYSITYTLKCEGDGGVSTSTANLAVAVPRPKLCSPTVINIQFDTNKSDIKPEFQDELKKVGDFLKEFPNARGVIEGHSDSVGDKASNMKLSQRRAESVRNYIIKNFGITPDRIKAKGYGSTKPVADNKTDEGKAQNRRIEANFVCK